MKEDIDHCASMKDALSQNFNGNMDKLMFTFNDCIDDIKLSYQNLQDNFEMMQSRLLDGQEDLIEKKAKWLQERQVIKRYNQINNNFVMINAGGTIVQTTIDNLTSVEDSRLERMFSGELTYIQ